MSKYEATGAAPAPGATVVPPRLMREVNHKQVHQASLVNKLTIGFKKWVFAFAAPSGSYPDFV